MAYRAGSRLSLALALLVCSASSALAAGPELDPDLMTVSGRAALPSGAGTPLEARLEVGALTIDPSVAAVLRLKPDALEDALSHAIEKSLKNYGYRWNGQPTATDGTPGLDKELSVFTAREKK